MNKLRIGYTPHGATLSHPADRRRLVYWAKKRGHQIILDPKETRDVNVLAGRSDFARKFERDDKVPTILDLVDGYLGQEDSWKDWARGIGKVFSGQLSGTPKPYRQIIANACLRSNAVICETPEQSRTITPFCANVHSILDFHEEFPMLPPNPKLKNPNYSQLMWEGLPFTISGLTQIEYSLQELSVSHKPRMQVVTDSKYPLLLGSYIYRDTERLLGSVPKILGGGFSMKEWSIESVIESSKSSDLAVLPLNPSSMLNPLKAENRLLILWRLGLPVLTSPSLAYVRVMERTGIAGICASPYDWKVKMERTLDSEELRLESVLAGQQYIRETHSEVLLLKAWDDLFESVL